MTIKDRLQEAIDSTPPENTHRLDTLLAALNAGDNDADVEAAIERLIVAREQKAAAFDRSGQPEQAKAEREEIVRLRELLQLPVAAKPARDTGKPRGSLLSRKQMIVGGSALVAVAVALAVTLGPWNQSDEDTASNTQKISVFKDDHTLGNPKAPTTIVEYAAPMCPHCAKFALEEFPQFKRDFVDTGKVFYIFRVFPLGGPDGAIEGIARCLPANRYFPYMETMFREQPQWDPDGYQIPDVAGAIVRLAATEGLSPERAKQCMADPAQQERINQIAQDAQLRYQLEATPTFIMDGQVVNIPPGKTASEVLRLRINSLPSLK